ncbi:MAG: orotidine-5'-phosphate decarboxylase [Chlorobi bacterium]|nr:orotidine-5'-phosphate decarboxylase [Chlorobiota bacterium]
MTAEKLKKLVSEKQTTLIVGLDIHYPEKFANLEELYGFIKSVIEVTAQYCIGYKVNTAFFESLGTEGWRLMEKVFRTIPESHFKIADAKRCDISSTNWFYRKAFFEVFGADALTSHLYFGIDALKDLYLPGKILMPVALPSQKEALDYLLIPTPSGKPWVFYLLERLKEEFTSNDVIPVVGSTLPENLLRQVSCLLDGYWFLMPGIGAQGGSPERVYRIIGLRALIPVSRAILYPKGPESTLKDIEGSARNFWQQTRNLHGNIKGTTEF